MKKAVVTILGMSGTKYNKERKCNELADECSYELGGKPEKSYNMLPILISEYGNEYVIESIYTEKSKEAQKMVLQATRYGEKVIFDDSKGLIKDENDFDEIFSIIDKIVSGYDEVIVDVSHGFRHLPILMIVDVIIRGLGNNGKISKILFAKEIEAFKSYEVIDLKQYVDLASFAFVVTNFKDNFTISNHIEIKKAELAGLIGAMKKFSGDILSLSLESLATKSSINLIEEIDKVLKDGLVRSFSFEKDLTELKGLIDKSFTVKGKKRYQSYYDIAKALFERGYYSNSLAILNEGVGFYIKTIGKQVLGEKIELIENKIKNKEEVAQYNFYALSSAFKNMMIHGYRFRDELNITGSDAELLSNSVKQSMGDEKYKNFRKFISDIIGTRNDLLHANSSGNTSDYKNKIEGFLKKYKEFCVNRQIKAVEKQKIMKKEKIEIIKKASEKGR